MKEPYAADDAFLAQLDVVRRRAGAVDLFWLGQSGFLIHHRGRWVLVDPYLSDSLTEKYAQSDKPHVRVARRVVDPLALARRVASVLTVTSSHGHTDHLDVGTLVPLVQRAVVDKVIVPKAVLPLAVERTTTRSRMSVPPPVFETADDGSVHQIGGGIRVRAVASAHETVERDEAGCCKYLGYVFEFSPFVGPDAHGSNWGGEKEFTVYHSGDTVLYDGLVAKLRPFKIDVALLPINGRGPERRVAGNLSGREAAQLAKDIGAKLVIPCHYDMFEFNTADPRDEFIPECERLCQPYKVLRAGERWSMP